MFALGRAQELLLILDEYWAAHPELHDVPIYYASSLAKKCMAGEWAGLLRGVVTFSLVPGQIFATQKRNGTKRRKLGLVHTARVLVRMLIPFPRIWGIRNLLYIPATPYRILVRFVKNGRAIILENGVFRVSCCFPRLLLA